MRTTNQAGHWYPSYRVSEERNGKSGTGPGLCGILHYRHYGKGNNYEQSLPHASDLPPPKTSTIEKKIQDLGVCTSLSSPSPPGRNRNMHERSLGSTQQQADVGCIAAQHVSHFFCFFLLAHFPTGKTERVRAALKYFTYRAYS